MAVTPRLVQACRRQKVDRTPVWFMRQAGRYLPEYRRVRERYGLLDICADAELTAEITLQPVRRYELDAAIIFADIMLPLVSMGVELEFVPGVGPGGPCAASCWHSSRSRPSRCFPCTRTSSRTRVYGPAVETGRIAHWSTPTSTGVRACAS